MWLNPQKVDSSEGSSDFKRVNNIPPLIFAFGFKENIKCALAEHKQKLTRYFITKKDLLKDKKGLQSGVCRHSIPLYEERARRSRKPFFRGEEEIRGGTIITIEFCYNHRVLSVRLLPGHSMGELLP